MLKIRFFKQNGMLNGNEVTFSTHQNDILKPSVILREKVRIHIPIREVLIFICKAK